METYIEDTPWWVSLIDDVRNEVTWLSLDFFSKYFLVCKTWLEMSTTQSMKLKFGRNKFDKMTVSNVQTRIVYRKKSHDPADEIIGELYLSKSIPNVSFKLMQYQKICNWHEIWSDQGYQNVSILLRLWSEFQVSKLFWRYNQKTNWIFTKLNICTKWNAQRVDTTPCCW